MAIDLFRIVILALSVLKSNSYHRMFTKMFMTIIIILLKFGNQPERSMHVRVMALDFLALSALKFQVFKGIHLPLSSIWILSSINVPLINI